MQTISSTDFHLPNQTAAYHGKVRDVYTIADKYVVMVATDRISAFDVVQPKPIPHKGQVLNQLAEYFLSATRDIAPNWLVSVPDPNVSIGLKCEPYRVEMVIRDCLIGHAWREYESGKRVLCGVELPEGLKEYDRFPAPIITPATKADEGHDEDISGEEIIARGIVPFDEYKKLTYLTQLLFARGQDMALDRGLFLADTKYEFGKLDGQIYVIDEIHTPDSARYFYSDSYDAFIAGESTEPPKHLSKEFVRQWLIQHGFAGLTGQTVPEMSDEVVQEISDKYIELFKQITGAEFVPMSENEDIIKRIENNLTKALENL
ncbi:MAG: phosphoribosylaminoimidazolesuccinocarboxamide synthase [Patescibacteria group bacterium]